MEAVLCGRNSNERRRGEGSEAWKTEVQGGLREETGFQSGSIASTLLPTRLDLGEVPESPVAEPGSLGVFAASLIVYRTQAKPLKLNRGSARLYIQTPINRQFRPPARDSPRSSPLKLAAFQLGKLALRGRGAESCRAVSPCLRAPTGRPGLGMAWSHRSPTRTGPPGPQGQKAPR